MWLYYNSDRTTELLVFSIKYAFRTGSYALLSVEGYQGEASHSDYIAQFKFLKSSGGALDNRKDTERRD
jgi:hypothetical protein